jgi:hypothetical protein
MLTQVDIQALPMQSITRSELAALNTQIARLRTQRNAIPIDDPIATALVAELAAATADRDALLAWANRQRNGR